MDIKPCLFLAKYNLLTGQSDDTSTLMFSTDFRRVELQIHGCKLINLYFFCITFDKGCSSKPIPLKQQGFKTIGLLFFKRIAMSWLLYLFDP